WCGGVIGVRKVDMPHHPRPKSISLVSTLVRHPKLTRVQHASVVSRCQADRTLEFADAPEELRLCAGVRVYLDHVAFAQLAADIARVAHVERPVNDSDTGWVIKKTSLRNNSYQRVG